MATNSRIGKRSAVNRPSNIVLSRTKSLSVQGIKQWKDAITLAQLPEEPQRLPLLDIYDSVLIDSHLQSILESRILRILGSKFKVVNDAGVENPELNKLFKKKWFYQFLKHAMWSRFLGTGVVELWDLDSDGELMHAGLIPRENTLPIDGLIVKEVGDTKGYPYKEGTLQNYYLQIGDNTDIGMLAKGAVDPLTKKFAKAAWAEYVEKYGIPPRVVTTDSRNDTRHQELADMLQDMVSNHWAVLQGGETLTMMPTAGVDAYSTFDNLIMRMNSEMSKRFLGQDGTSDNKDASGTYGSLKVMQDVAEDRHEDDRTFINYLVNDELLWRLPLISGAYSKLANHRLEWDDSKEQTPEEYTEGVAKIYSAGYLVDPLQIEEKTGFKIVGKVTDYTSNEDGGSDGDTITQKKKSKLSAKHQAEITAIYPSSTNTEIFAIGDKLQKPFENWAREIYYTKTKVSTPWTFIEKMADILLEAIEPKAKMKATGPIVDSFYANLASNIFMFSAAKTFTSYAEISQLLSDTNGKPKSFTAFKEDVLKLHATYNVRYLKTEYNNAVRTAQMAAQWKTFESQKDLFDLQYDTAGDSKVRKDHAKLDNITLPVDHPFWERNYPPLDFGCRCGIRQVAKGSPVTPDEKLNELPKPTKQFQFNAGKKQLIFSDGHPYIKTLLNEKKTLFAIQDYGLKTGAEIYAKGKGLTRSLKALDSKDAALNWFESISEKGIAILNTTFLGKKWPIELNSKTVTKINNAKGARYKWINNLPKAIATADEIYSTKNTYTFISYFNDTIRIITSNKQFGVTDAFEVDLSAVDRFRTGTLLHSKR